METEINVFQNSTVSHFNVKTSIFLFKASVGFFISKYNFFFTEIELELDYYHYKVNV